MARRARDFPAGGTDYETEGKKTQDPGTKQRSLGPLAGEVDVEEGPTLSKTKNERVGHPGGSSAASNATRLSIDS